jgi:hypothetical protein
MTSFWLWVAVGCAGAAVGGFAAMRLGSRALHHEDAADASVAPEPDPAARTPAAGAPPARGTATTASPPAASAVAPTAPEPPARQLRMWARQVESGERKMSIATDGCRVTWNRLCRHGHPSWLVHLGYLRPRSQSAPLPAKKSGPVDQ